MAQNPSHPRSDPDPHGERPWTEEQWEQFMYRADARCARYHDLFETLIDHPDRDQIIRKEMGWKLDEELATDAPPAEEDEDPLWTPDAEAAAPAESEEDVIPSATEMGDTGAEIDRDMMEIAAYARTRQAMLRIDESLRQLPATSPEQDLEDEDLHAVASGLLTAMGKLGNGHGMGYEDEVLCGNIVQCRRAPEGGRTARQGLERLVERRVLGEVLGRELVAEVAGACAAIEERIVELRKRVWWSQPNGD